MLHRVCLLICLVALAAPAGAVAQSNPFGPINPAPLPQPAPDTGEDTDTNEGEGELEGWQELAIFGGGGLLLVGIAWMIIRDAHHKAPVEDRRRRDESAFGATPDKPRDPHAPRRKQVARQKAKAARKARKTTKRGR